MADTITAEERAAIDKAVSRGRVTHVPAGRTSFSGYQWDASKKTLAAKNPDQVGFGFWRTGKRGPGDEAAKLRLRIRELAVQGMHVDEIAAAVGVAVGKVRYHANAAGISIAPKPRQAQKTLDAIAQRRAAIPDLVTSGMTGNELAAHFGVSRATIAKDLKDLDISLRRSAKAPPVAQVPEAEVEAPEHADKARAKKEAGAEEGVRKVRDRRRFKTVPVPIGNPSRVVSPDARGTIFPTRVFDPIETEHVLKDGASNAKIGGDVLVGWLKGARIFTLTLEERETCPRSCPLWRGCYGNSMQHARRWRHGEDLERAISLEMADLCSTHDRVLVRLHVLGDFYSVGYVKLWRRLLTKHAGLNIFGFTARRRGTDIGDALWRLGRDFVGRVWLRESDRTGPWGSFTLDFPTEKKRIGDAIVCPEQRDAMNGVKRGTHCGSCAVCWSTDKPIAFVEH